MAENILIKEWLKMSEGYKQQTVKTVPSHELGEYWEEGFRTLIICTSRSQRKFLAQFKAILIVFPVSFQGTLFQDLLCLSDDKMKWFLCFSISSQLHFSITTFKLILHDSSITTRSSRDFPDAVTYSQWKIQLSKQFCPQGY